MPKKTDNKPTIIKCRKCGRETYKAEVEEFTMRNICKGCELVESVCRCRPLNIKPLFGGSND